MKLIYEENVHQNCKLRNVFENVSTQSPEQIIAGIEENCFYRISTETLYQLYKLYGVNFDIYKRSTIQKLFPESVGVKKFDVCPVDKLLDRSYVDYLVEKYGEKVFVKPDSFQKQFSGRVVKTETILNNIDYGFYWEDFNFDVFICEEISIKEEFRFLIFKNSIVDYSGYETERTPTKNVCSYNVIKFVESVVDKIDLSSMYILDVGITEDEPIVLETNPINSSDLYNLDINRIKECLEEY